MKTKIFLLLLLLFTLWSCAEEATDYTVDEWEEQVIESYLYMNYPDEAAMIIRDVNDYYLIVRDESNRTGIVSPTTADYVRFDVKGKLLNGSVFKVTRYEDAEVLMYPSTALYSKHYVPVFDSLGTTSTTIPPAVAKVLQTMMVGDSVVLVVPSQYAYGSSSHSETGMTAVAANSPVVFEIVLREVITESRTDYEHQILERYKDSMNIVYAAAGAPLFQTICDTVDCPKNIYVRYIDTVPVTDSTPLPQTDTAMGLKYVGYYLDGFWLDTNIDSIARRNLKQAYKLQTSYTTTYSFTMGSTTSITAFTAALGRLNVGSTIEFVFSSEYAYGSTGNGNVPPYTPLRFVVYRQE